MTMSRRELFGMFRGRGPAHRPPTDGEPAVVPPSAPGSAPSSDANVAPRVASPASTPAAAARTNPGSDGTPVPRFSLDAFYAARTGVRALPPFAIRATVTPPTAGATPIPSALVPEVLSHRCLATTSFCSVCIERCPVPGALVVELGLPRVEAARCDGCGHCVAACPAPILALALVPRRATKESG